MPHVFDPRHNNLAVSLTYLRPGQLPGQRDLSLQVTNGEGQVWLDPAVTPTIGAITQGRLVIASEHFPRFAPLTLRLTGADLRFHVRRGLLLNFELVADQATPLRLHCTGLWTAAYRYRLRRPPDKDKVIVTRINSVDNDRETSLEIDVLKGSLDPSPGFEQDTNGIVNYGKLDLRRANDGELKVQMHGARMEWDFANGVLSALRVFDSRGAIANLWVLDMSGAGIAVTAALMDTLG
jgi:hypothetical protein